MSFDLNGLKTNATKIFENSLKSMQIFQILMVGMNFRERLQKNQTSTAVRSECATWNVDKYYKKGPYLLKDQIQSHSVISLVFYLGTSKEK